jgi:peptidoglycan/LPS O-acetylase OafA/YrhL
MHKEIKYSHGNLTKMLFSKRKEERIMYVNQLTQLRGVAALFVVFAHIARTIEYSYYTADPAIENSVFDFFGLGSFGVILFFTLSGCTLFISNNSLPFNKIQSFYIKRFLRIWPAFIVSLIFYFLFRMVFEIFYTAPTGAWIEAQFIKDFNSLDIFLYATLSFNFFGQLELFNNAYWSLPVEFQYYLLFPLFVYLITHKHFLAFIFAAIVFYALPRAGMLNISSNLIFSLSFSFTGGILIGYLYKRYVFDMKQSLAALILIIILILVLVIKNNMIKIDTIPFLSNKWNFYIICSTIIVFITLNVDFKIQDRLGAILIYLGKTSYSTYLYHNLAIAFSLLVYLNINIQNGLLKILFIPISSLIITLLIAHLSYIYIEVPSIKLGKKLSRK